MVAVQWVSMTAAALGDIGRQEFYVYTEHKSSKIELQHLLTQKAGPTVKLH